MAEYILREQAIRAVTGAKLPDVSASGLPIANGKRSVTDCVRRLKEIPAADARPVVRGRWVYTDMSRLVCSNCGNPVAFALKDDGWHHGDYCTNCGARMEES